MNSFTHKRRDYRITAILLTQEMTLANGQVGHVGDYFISDEEGQQYFMSAERLEREYVAFGTIKVEKDDSITRILGGQLITFDPEKYRISD